MSFLDLSGVVAFWNKAKASFGGSLSVSGPTITLKNKADTPTNLSQVTIPNATTSTAGVMSASDKSKLDGVAQSANNYSHPTFAARGSGLYKITVDANGHVCDVVSVSKTDITSLGIPAQDTNTTYGVATASVNGLMASADKSKLDAIDTRISTAIASANVGHSVYQGTVSKELDISATSYKKGWYWVVGTSGTYCGDKCDPGDFIYANSDKGSAFSAAHFDIVQANLAAITVDELNAVLV